MATGFRQISTWTAFALAGLSSLMVSCAGLTAASSRDAERLASLRTSEASQGTPTSHGPMAVHLDEEVDAPSLELQFQAVARKVVPSVVAISAIETPTSDEALLHPELANPDRLNAALATYDRTVGTGFVIDSAGYIVTNEHVVARSAQVWVTTDDHKVYPAIVVGSDPRSDLAVLKIAANHLPAVRLADKPVTRGMWTMAVGNPYGLAGDGDLAVSVGVVSAVGRSLPKLSGKEDRLYQDLIQTTAQINPGNSGGPLFDLRGNVIGVNCAVILPVKQTNGIGFALPVGPRLLSIIDRLRTGRPVTYAYLGVRSSTASAADCRAACLPDDAGGARVDFVEPSSPAAEAGLKTGDLVVSVAGQTIIDSEHFIMTVGDAPVGTPVPAVIRRDGKQMTVQLKLRPRESTAAPVTRVSQRFVWRGVTLGTSATGGVTVVAVDARSPLAGNVKPGDIVTSFAGRNVTGLTDLMDILRAVPMAKCNIDFAGVVATVQE
jgi:serine protease Do